ncbi:MAG: cytochrome c [Planctomycetota bacterium]
MSLQLRQLAVCIVALWVSPLAAQSPDKTAETEFTPNAARGYQLLTTKPYLPPDFDQEVFDELWKVWPKTLRDQARNATPAERRQLAFTRYGMVESPEHPGEGTAWGYTSDGQGGWVMNCLSCHGGQINGKAMLGLPNSNFGLETLVEDVRATKIRLGKKLTHMDMAQLGMPLGTTHGTTNSVIFGVALEAKRDVDMKVLRTYTVPAMQHHDLDAPPFWNVKKKSRLYYDGLVKKHHRPLIQFVLLPRNDEKVLASWENDYRDILAWIESLQAPRYPFPVDATLASAGQTVFNGHCAKCHGTYGDQEIFPERVIDLAVLGTDPIRLNALSPIYREKFQHSWLANYNTTDPVWLPKGYIAPSLNGIWASAPYLHNGSVPTLWHMLHAEERPQIWKRTPTGYDQQRVGLEISTPETVPEGLLSGDRRQYFDTSKSGKSSAGHRFPDELNEDEKQAVLEYLKTL